MIKMINKSKKKDRIIIKNKRYRKYKTIKRGGMLSYLLGYKRPKVSLSEAIQKLMEFKNNIDTTKDREKLKVIKEELSNYKEDVIENMQDNIFLIKYIDHLIKYANNKSNGLRYRIPALNRIEREYDLSSLGLRDKSHAIKGVVQDPNPEERLWKLPDNWISTEALERRRNVMNNVYK